jgi:hypothetical protein
MAKAKAKWLEESSNKELLEIVKAGISGDEAAGKKAPKAVDELLERTPDTDGEVSVEEALANLEVATNVVKAAYQAELDAMDGDLGDTEEGGEDEEEGTPSLADMSKKELVEIAKELGIKGAKKKSQEELIKLIEEAQGETEEEDGEDDVDYSEMSKKELIAECKDRGLKVNKKDSTEKLIAALEADDKDK